MWLFSFLSLIQSSSPLMLIKSVRFHFSYFLSYLQKIQQMFVKKISYFIVNLQNLNMIYVYRKENIFYRVWSEHYVFCHCNLVIVDNISQYCFEEVKLFYNSTTTTHNTYYNSFQKRICLTVFDVKRFSILLYWYHNNENVI